VTALALGVDHLNTAVEDVRAVAGVLTDKLGLSVVVPYSEYPAFVTIGAASVRRRCSSTARTPSSSSDRPARPGGAR
jgi:hypothetical protein